MNPLDDLRKAIQEGLYELAFHAAEEAADDDLHLLDLESALLTGRLAATQPDPQGARSM